MHGCQDHAKVNQMAKTKYSGTVPNEQIEPANFQSFAEIQKTKSTLHIKFQTLAKTKIVLEATCYIPHTPKPVYPNSKINFIVAFHQTSGQAKTKPT